MQRNRIHATSDSDVRWKFTTIYSLNSLALFCLYYICQGLPKTSLAKLSHASSSKNFEPDCRELYVGVGELFLKSSAFHIIL